MFSPTRVCGGESGDVGGGVRRKTERAREEGVTRERRGEDLTRDANSSFSWIVWGDTTGGSEYRV